MGRGRDNVSAISHPSPSLRGGVGASGEGVEVTEHLGQIAELAWSWEPDWDAVFDGADHNWCGEASREVAAHLTQAGIQARVVSGGFRGNGHTWVELSDGTIIDPTIEQYIDRTDERHVVDAEVPWRGGEEDGRVAVIPPSHALHGDYETEQRAGQEAV